MDECDYLVSGPFLGCMVHEYVGGAGFYHSVAGPSCCARQVVGVVLNNYLLSE